MVADFFYFWNGGINFTLQENYFQQTCLFGKKGYVYADVSVQLAASLKSTFLSPFALYFSPLLIENLGLCELKLSCVAQDIICISCSLILRQIAQRKSA